MPSARAPHVRRRAGPGPMVAWVLLAGCLLPRVALHGSVCGELAAPALRPRQAHLLAARAAEHREPWSCTLQHQRSAGPGASAQPTPVAQAQAQRAPLAAAPGAPPQAPPPAAQREPQLGKGGPEKTASGAPSNGTDNSVGSGAENQDTGKRADSATADKGANGADSLESLEQEKQLAWKKEKRRKQIREAQRRFRARLAQEKQLARKKEKRRKQIREAQRRFRDRLARARRGAGSTGPAPVCERTCEGGRRCAAQEGCRKLGDLGQLAPAAGQGRGKRPRAGTAPGMNGGDGQQEGCETRSSSSQGGGEETRGHGGGAEAEAIHWPREEVQSLALVQEGDVEALLQHLASTYYEKHGELATEADLKLWGECLRSMRVDCTEVTHASR